MLTDNVRLEVKKPRSAPSINRINRCQWLTTFDDENNSFQLQQRISRWSDQRLKKVLAECIAKVLPDNIAWRLERLELDLGAIDYDYDLEYQLEQRVAICLLRQLSSLLYQTEQDSGHLENLSKQHTKGNRSELESAPLLVSETQSYDQTLRQFLATGRYAWWHKETNSINALLQRQLAQAPLQTEQTLRHLGQQENVRRRMVWQWPEQSIRPIISLLEPYHDEFIFAFSEQLFNAQKKHQKPPCAHQEFRQYTWFWILTHLLVETGSVFNTRSFVDATLQKMALHFHIEYCELLTGLLVIAQQQQTKLVSTPAFIMALLTLAQQKKVLPSKQPEQRHSSDGNTIWQLFINKLLHRSIQTGDNTHLLEQASLSELVMILAVEQPKKLLYLLKQKTQQKKRLKYLIKHLDSGALTQLVALTAPLEHSFISQYAHQACTSFEHSQVIETKQIVWQVILTYLLTNHGSQFNRCQFVHNTLLALAKRQGVSYLVLLELFAITSQTWSGKSYQFELLTIVEALRKNERHKSTSTRVIALYQKGLTHYLLTGHYLKVIDAHYVAHPRQQFSLVLKQDPTLLSALIRTLYNPPIHHQVTASELAERLFELSAINDMEQILDLIQARSGYFISTFINQLSAWKTQLPCLYRIDLTRNIYRDLLTQLIAASNNNFSVAVFLTAFSHMLYADYGVNQKEWRAQLATCLTKIDATGTFDNQDHKKICTWLTKVSETATTIADLRASLADTQRNKTRLMLDKAITYQQLKEMLSHHASTHSMQLTSELIAFIFSYCRANQYQQQQLQLHGLLAQISISSVLASLLKQSPSLLMKRLSQQVDVHDLITKIKKLAPQAWLSNIDKQCSDIESAHVLTGLKSQWQGLIWRLLSRQPHLWSGSKIQLRLLIDSIWQQALLEHILSHSSAVKEQNNQLFLMLILKLTCVQLHLSVAQCCQQVRVLLQQEDSKPQSLLSDSWLRVLRIKKEKNINSNINLSDSVEILTDSDLRAIKMQPSTLANDVNPVSQDPQRHYLTQTMVIELTCHLLEFGRLPLWFDVSSLRYQRYHQKQRLQLQKAFSLPLLISDLVYLKPELLAVIINLMMDKNRAIERLQRMLDYPSLLRIMQFSSCQLGTQLAELNQIYTAFSTFKLTKIPAKQLQLQLWQLTLRSWATGDCQLIVTRKIIETLISSLSVEYHQQINTIVREFHNQQSKIPSAYLMEKVSQVMQNSKQYAQQLLLEMHEKSNAAQFNQDALLTTPIAISNAGLVLMQSFFPSYFNRAGLLEQGVFKSEQQQKQALHFLQFLVCGQTETEEQYLVLNKIICGIDIDQAVPVGITLSANDKKTAEGLLQAVIDHWSAIGTSSLHGFRGNWLIRKGLLTETEKQWELAIEGKAYDLLLKSIPFSFSLIKFPWMKKPLYVNWPH